MFYTRDILKFLNENKEKLILVETNTQISEPEKTFLKSFSDQQKTHGYSKVLTTKKFEFELKDYLIKTNYEDKLTIKTIISDLTDFNVEID